MTRIAVVCGAAGGIGSASVNRLRAQGWAVIGIDRRSDADGLLAADVSEPDGVARALEVIRPEGRVHAVVNCVGEQLVRTIREASADDWDVVFKQNARTAFLITKLGIELMLDHAAGSIVHVASVHAQASSPGMAAYAASKGAVVSFARAAAVELAAFGLRVNVVSPGAVDTPMLHRGIAARNAVTETDGLARLLERTPLSRLAGPEDVAAAIEFMADEERSGFVTGQVLVVDGGVTARIVTE